MNEKMTMLTEALGSIVSQDTIQKLGDMIPNNVPPAGVVPIIASVVKRLPQSLTGDEVLEEVKKQMAGKSKDNKAQSQENPGSVRGLTRKYYDSLLLEMRLMGAVEPNTEIKLFGHAFSSPIMTGAMSHMSLLSEKNPPNSLFAGV